MISVRGRSKSTSLSVGGDFCSIAFLALDTKGSRFVGKYQSHANETAMYVVSGVCLFKITWQHFKNSSRSLPGFRHFRKYWLPCNETAIFLFSGSTLYIVTWQRYDKCAWSLKIDLPFFRGWLLLHSIFGTGQQGKPISRKISIARNETAIYVVSGVCLFRITWQHFKIGFPWSRVWKLLMQQKVTQRKLAAK